VLARRTTLEQQEIHGPGESRPWSQGKAKDEAMKKVLLAPAVLAVGIACAPLAQADVPGLGPFVGQWVAPGESLTVNADGSGTETYDGGSVNFQIGGVQPPPPQPDYTAYGNITSGGYVERGSYVAITLVDDGQGVLLSVANGDSGLPFCKIVDGSKVNSADCGA
jgi:hypothetical protein